MFLRIYLVILMMLYILQSNRNCQVAFSFTVIQIYLCRLKLLTLIEEMISYFSCFHISQVEEGIIIQFAYTQCHFKTCPCEGKASLSLTLYYKKKSSVQEWKQFTGSQGGLVVGKSGRKLPAWLENSRLKSNRYFLIHDACNPWTKMTSKLIFLAMLPFWILT